MRARIALTFHTAFYQWYPTGRVEYENINLSPGDSVSAIVVALSPTSGIVSIINHSTGQQASVVLEDQVALCQQDAEWIVGQGVLNGAALPLADFGTVTITSASARTDGAIGPAETIYNIKENEVVLTSTSATGDSVTVNYIGPGAI